MNNKEKMRKRGKKVENLKSKMGEGKNIRRVRINKHSEERKKTLLSLTLY